MSDINIDELLGEIPSSISSGIPLDEKPEPAPGEDVGALVHRLSEWSSGGRDMFIDLRTAKFRSDDGGMWMELPEGFLPRRIDFKRDPTNPKDARIILAQKQFCKMLGMPHSFFSTNRPAMRESLVKSMQAGLEADEKKGRCIARIREGGSVAMVRALFPENAVPPRAVDIISAVVGSLGPEGHLEFVFGDGKDDLILHTRFVLKDSLMIHGKDYRIAFDMIFSELGAVPMSVDVMVFDPLHRVFFAALYGGESFFSSKYAGLQAKDVSDMIPILLMRLRGEWRELSEVMESSIDNVFSVQQACMSISRSKGLTAAMRKAVFHEAEQVDDISTKLDLARHVALVAKDFDSLKRLALERAAGKYLGLCFSRGIPDEIDGSENG